MPISQLRKGREHERERYGRLPREGAPAAYTVIEPDASILTIEFKVNLMSPGRGERFLFRGEITKPGSTIIVADGRAYAIGDGPAKLIASMTGTMMVIRGREDVTG
jgi:acyl-coenzyme A thioesterase PaaI-like protein